MDGDKPENSQPSVASNTSPYAYYAPEDEINLVDLWKVLVRRKKELFGVAGVVTLGAVLYALLATPVYRAETVFLPPAASDIEALNIEGVQQININSVYTMFEQNLSSKVFVADHLR